VRGSVLTAKWSTLEPIPKVYSLQDLANGIALLGGQWGFKLMLGIQVINTVPKETPSDLISIPFSDPQMKARFHALIDALKPALTSQVAYLSIGNEVDVYLSANPDQWPMYKDFLDDAQNYVHQVSPQLRVGTTVTFGGATGPDANQVAQLTSSTDVYILTYYPLGPDFHALGAQSPLTDFPRMLGLAGNRPLVLQEVGYPSSQILSSSEDQEAQFVTSVFQAWQSAGNQAEFLSYFLLHDFPASLCDSLAGYYNLPNDTNFKAYLCSVGLRRVDGTPKAAWQAFVDGARTVGR
jgi:hypothetical protein